MIKFIKWMKNWSFTLLTLACMWINAIITILKCIKFKITYRFRGYNEQVLNEYLNDAYDYINDFCELECEKLANRLV